MTTATWQLAGDALGAELRRHDHVERMAHVAKIQLAAEAQQRGLPRQAGCRDLAAWLRRELPTASPGEAARIAARAEAFYRSPAAPELAPTREALMAGVISGEQADVIASTVAALLPPQVPAGVVPDEAVEQVQALLLGETDRLDPKALAKIAAKVRASMDPDADDRLACDEHRQEQVRGVTLVPMDSGMWHLEALLTKRAGAALKAAVDAWSAPQPAADGTPDPRTGAQRRHDALHRLAEEAVAQPGLLPTSHGSAYRVVVTVSSETFAAALSGEAQQGLLPAELPDGQHLSSAALAEISCTAEMVPILLDQVGNPLDVGRTQYPFPAKQRLAIAVRDQHCTFPGCTAPPAWCDVHHTTPFSRGGKTSVSTGTLVCGRHHRHV
ncbi:HNH endonuclease signature motif containing protein, partial [Angustibacter peucedani]